MALESMHDAQRAACSTHALDLTRRSLHHRAAEALLQQDLRLRRLTDRTTTTTMRLGVEGRHPPEGILPSYPVAFGSSNFYPVAQTRAREDHVRRNIARGARRAREFRTAREREEREREREEREREREKKRRGGEEEEGEGGIDRGVRSSSPNP